MDLIKRILRDKRFLKLVRYGFFGVCTTFVNFAVFKVLKDLAGIELNISNTIAIITSILFAYITNKLFVFKSITPNLKSLTREIVSFFSARAITMFLEIAGIFIVHTAIKVDESYSIYTKAALNVLVLLLNFIFSQWFVFKNKQTNSGTNI